MSDTRKIGIYGMVPIALLQDARVKPNMLKAYAALASFQGGTENCYPSVAAIAERAGMKLDAVSDATTALEKAGWIRKTRRANERKTNLYEVLVDVEPVENEGKNPDIGEIPNSEKSRKRAYSEKSRKPSINKKNIEKNTSIYEDFEEAWKHYPRKVGKKAAYKAYKARRKEVDKDTLLTATINYAKAVEHTEQRYIKQGPTFYGPDEWYADYVGTSEPEKPTYVAACKQCGTHNAPDAHECSGCGSRELVMTRSEVAV